MGLVRVLVIVPNLPPFVDGVGDYALQLASQIRSLSDKFIFEFLVAGNTKYPYEVFEGFKIYNIDLHTGDELFNKLVNINTKHLLLHYVGYGYAKRGAPLWLYKGLRMYIEQKDGIIQTMFHELYATSFKPWTSSFWNQLVQIWICRKLSLLSNDAITSSTIYKKILRRFNKKISIKAIPVFCNFPEADILPLESGRSRQLVVFGSRANREFIYNNYGRHLTKICDALSLNIIVDIGPICRLSHDLNVELLQMGPISADRVREVLSVSFAGVIGFYKEDYLAKSGVFAAFACYGVLPIILNTNGNMSKPGCVNDGLIPNVNYCRLKDLTPSNSDPIRISLMDWYHNHDLTKQAKIYKELLLKVYNEENH